MGRLPGMKEGLSLFGLPAGQKKKGRKIALSALLYSRSTALESLLSVALSSVGLFDCTTRFLFV
jgi:hypothetical protein